MKLNFRLFLLALLCLIIHFLNAQAPASGTRNATISFNDQYHGIKPKLYPNPNDGNIIFIDWKGIEGNPINIGIFNTSGKLFYRSNITTKIDQVDLSDYDLRPGYYIFELTTDDNTYMLKTLVN